jgi:hypothetical protein
MVSRILVAATIIVALGSARANAASCLSITTPAPGANLVRGSVINVGFSDTCHPAYFECLLVDGVTLQCATPTPQHFIWDSSAYYSLGAHTIEVTSWTKNAGRKLGDVLESVNLVDAP